MIRVYLGMGSNLQEPNTQLATAVTALRKLSGTHNHSVSRVYQGPPMGPQNQPEYLNAVIAMDTTLEPLALLRALQHIELTQGRERLERWGPRTLDLDILLYGSQVVDLPDLQIPHPGLALRKFVLQPLLDLADSKWVLPDGKELGTLAADCPGEDLQPTSQQLNL
ncbi:MAG: 2-amino-4-hydroxy-6-hydroxymethyldihydropteridine diphosphokinase [Halieaceae bacterium]|jgi:2-amino-4-hydroxy-6-hydroxymethyldihydropteridine diphosphokinase